VSLFLLTALLSLDFLFSFVSEKGLKVILTYHSSAVGGWLGKDVVIKQLRLDSRFFLFIALMDWISRTRKPKMCKG